MIEIQDSSFLDKLKGTLSHRLAAFRDHLGPASIVLVVILGAGAALLWPGAPLASWLWGSEQDNTLILSGNIEAHESVLSFKTIQSRITELPFDEGATVKAGTVLARTENADYRQQVAIDFAALEVQQRQLAVDEQNVDSARQTVISDRADLAEKKLDLGRDEALLKKQAISTQARDLQLTAEKQSAATLNRDRALERAAERNVELAIGQRSKRQRYAQAGQNRSRLHGPYRPLHRRHPCTPGGTGRKRRARQSCRDARRHRSRLAARLCQ